MKPTFFEGEALAYEVELIAKHGRRCDGSGTLANLTAGGEGTFGLKISEIGRANIVAASRGRKLSAEARANIAKGCVGRRHSDETKKKISEVQKGKKRGPRGEEFRQKMREVALKRGNSVASEQSKETNAALGPRTEK